MEDQDKIYEQFKVAAHKAETKDFDALEKVWSRVDAKLDTKVLKKQNNNWKKLMIAASIILLTTIAYQFLKPNNDIVLPNQLPQNEVVIQENQPETIDEKPIEIIKENAAEILKKQIAPNAETVAVVIAEEENKEADVTSNQSIVNQANRTLKGNVFESRGVKQEMEESDVLDAKKQDHQISKQSAPLLIINGKAITQNKKRTKNALTDIENDEIESIVELKEPLYIINGVQYSEESLFGPKPTSPYAPLDQQEIIKTDILQGTEAVTKYGEKGKKGVVIITTKTGKPAVPK